MNLLTAMWRKHCGARGHESSRGVRLRHPLHVTVLAAAFFIALSLGSVTRSAAVLDEGLYRPGQITVPFDVERALRAVVRIRSHVYFAVTVYEDSRQVSAAAATAEKVFLPEGITIWPVVARKVLLDRLRVDPGLRLRPAYYEIAQAYENVASFPSQQFIPLEGAATGFFISPEGHFLTSYHVVREEIEAANRTEGSDTPVPCRYLSFEVPVVENGQVVGYQPLKNVQLLRNVSWAEFRSGLDGALLKAEIQSPAYFEMDSNGVVADMPVWSLGFPIRSLRDEQRLASLAYEDADGGLRMTQGKTQQALGESNFTASLDGLSGSSGGPILNQQGRAVGMVQDVFPEKEKDRRAVVFSGGMTAADIRAVLKRLGVGSDGEIK